MTKRLKKKGKKRKRGQSSLRAAAVDTLLAKHDGDNQDQVSKRELWHHGIIMRTSSNPRTKTQALYLFAFGGSKNWQRFSDGGKRLLSQNPIWTGASAHYSPFTHTVQWYLKCSVGRCRVIEGLFLPTYPPMAVKVLAPSSSCWAFLQRELNIQL